MLLLKISPVQSEELAAPFRAQILSREALGAHAQDIAQRYPNAFEKIRSASLQRRFRDNCRILEHAYFSFSAAARNKEVLTAGAEWLLDNYHVVEEQATEIRRDLPWRYYRALPKLKDPEWAGLPRVYHLACDFISHTDGQVEAETLASYIRGYQKLNTLKIGELWAVPIMLRLALVENLRRLAQAALRAREHRLLAENFFADTFERNESAQSAQGGADLLVQLAKGVSQNSAILDECGAYLIRRLRAKGSSAALSLKWLYEKLTEKGVDADKLLLDEQQGQAADQISVGNSITALKSIGSINWREWFEKVSLVDEILSRDPAGIYAASDFTTRDLYRHRIERLARRNQEPETAITEKLLDFVNGKAKQYSDDPPNAYREQRYKHIGYYLIGPGRREFAEHLRLRQDYAFLLTSIVRDHALKFYLGTIALVTWALSLAAAGLLYFEPTAWWFDTLVLCLLLLPISEHAIQIVQWLVTRTVRPRALAKLDFEKGIPDEFRSAIAVQTICPDKDALERTVSGLEIRFLSNDDDNLMYGVLADLPDSPSAVLPGDRGLINRACELIGELNRKHCRPECERFFVLFRERKWNPKEGKWMGWERKRGKIMEFNRWLRGASDTTFVASEGDTDRLRTCRFVITLDNDTQLPSGAARKLIGTLAHPLNRAVISAEDNKVESGYAIIQPRVGITLQSATASRFAEIFSGQVGLDPYTRAVSDVYQDLFGEGSYVGKGVYEVDAFEAALHRRVPENALLSHDLFEGFFGRVGLASDIELFDEFPAKYNAYVRREHRWIRGDWQLLPWIFRRVPHAAINQAEPQYSTSSLSWLSWWKLLDNLRRSLVGPSLLAFFFVALGLAGQGSVALAVYAIALLFTPLYLLFLGTLLDFQLGYSLSIFAKNFTKDVYRQVCNTLVNLITLPHQAANSLHAITVTLWRVLISKRQLLEWETAHAAEKRLGSDLASFLNGMRSAVAIAAVFYAVCFFGAGLSAIAGLLCVLWACSPIFAWALSLPPVKMQSEISEDDREYLRGVAYSTWMYFDAFLVPEYNYLIPDNLQVVPSRVVAERTSPTNISLSMMSVMSALDLGFTSVSAALRRLLGTVTTLGKLERFHGHFVNWWQITDARPLAPRYVSTVDSGNLAGHFIAIAEGLKEIPHKPMLGPWQRNHLKFLLHQHSSPDSNNLLKQIEMLNSTKDLANLRQYAGLLKELGNFRGNLIEGHANPQLMRFLDELLEMRPSVRWVEYLPLVQQLSSKQALHRRLSGVDRILEGRAPTISLLLKITDRLSKISSVVDRSLLSDQERSQLSEFDQALEAAKQQLQALIQSTETISANLERFVKEMDFTLLFDQRKKLMVIGHNIDTGHPDNSYYDLLASEARLGSIVAIAKGDLPQSHWFMLNRALVDSDGGKALISWSGTMFEYLMPLLVMKDFPGTLLSETYSSVVKAQRIYARRRGVPWGVSESAYSGVDFEKTYQYRAFGVPGLGLKRGLSEDLVISPYSSALALLVDAKASVQNLRTLEKLGVRGEYGFYEAADFTKERLGSDESIHIVKNFLAHHQGMTVVAINNLLNDGIFQKRFHSSALLRATEILLHERFPARVPLMIPHQAELSLFEREESEARAARSERFKSPHTPTVRCRVLSNGRYSVLLDNSGSGYSFVDGNLCLNRTRLNALGVGSGFYVYMRDVATGGVWSNTYHPTRVEPEDYEVIFNPEKIEYRRRDQGVSVHTEITVSPEDSVEVRRITVTNTSARLRVIELTSFGEVVLASASAFNAHPAFSRMFISSEFDRDLDALIFARRPRSSSEKSEFLLHSVSMPVVWEPVQCESSREKFIGRGRDITNPVAVERGGLMSGSVGSVLDPIFALRTRVEVEPGSSQQVTFLLGYAESKEAALDLARKYREGHHVARAFELAWSRSDVEIRHQQFTIRQGHAFQHLAAALFYNHDKWRAPSSIIAGNQLSQQSLWRLGISGDQPIVLVNIRDPEHAKLARELSLAHEYLRLRGVRFDLVLLNHHPGGYMQNLQEELELMVRTGFARDSIDKPGGVFLRVAQNISEQEINLLHAVARVVLEGEKGSLASQLKYADSAETEIVRRRQAAFKHDDEFSIDRSKLEFDNGIGGFAKNGSEYRMLVRADRLPPQPWSNVVANPKFGFLVTESGAGYTWADNSRENRITPWSNDPVTDPFGEVIYLRDVDSGAFWCPTPRPVFHGNSVEVTHGFGYSRFLTKINQIGSELTLSGSLDEKVKWWHLELANYDQKERTLDIFLYVDWVLGVNREQTATHIVTSYDQTAQALIARNPFNIEYSTQLAFIGCSHKIQSFTSDRTEFIGRHGDPSTPLALEQFGGAVGIGALLGGQRKVSSRLMARVGGGFSNCGVIKVQIALAPGEKRAVLFFLGQTDSESHLRALCTRYRSIKHWSESYDSVKRTWSGLCSAVKVKTPERSFDIMVNGWLIYQTVSSRILARTGFYQSSGAFGFRDQLQDSMALLYARPQETRKQILYHAGRQFVEGDVQHWWHPPTGRGIRSRISDNYLWLPYALLEYLNATGDDSILNEQVSFLEGPQLGPDDHDLYMTPQVSSHRASLYEHAVIALDRVLSQLGGKGMPLMGGGDWNDGMNQVGIRGQGESVWLGWFVAQSLLRFADIVAARNDQYRANEYREKSKAIVNAIESKAWDGEWYLRAFFDDGTPIGCSRNSECRIDSLTQSWSVISGLGQKERQKVSMEAVFRELVRGEDGLIRLLWPPFHESVPSPGYIQGYPRGLRENGGQYTHAAAWVVMATALLGRGSMAMRLFQLINPIERSKDSEAMARYMTEPYAMCGDVYSVAPHVGRGGWSWYTGSAGWLYRVAIESILGLKLEGKRLRFDPCIPAEWPQFSIEFVRGQVTYAINVENPQRVERGVKSVSIDGKISSDNSVPLIEADEAVTASVRVVMG